MRVILLGPQRQPTVDGVLRSLELDGPVAMVTAGWREREGDDGELAALSGGRGVGLGLYRRWLDVADRDPVYAAGERRLQELLAKLGEVYLLRLDHALQAVYELQRRGGGPAGAAANAAGAGAALSQALDEAIAAVRELDAAHLRHVNEVRGEFYERLAPHDRPVIAGHRAEVEGLLREAAALLVAGGHVGVLADVLHLFNVAAAARSAPGHLTMIAWSAGAMALADRIVLFHDRAPQGPGHPEVYGNGLSLVRRAVLLPHARARLRLDDTARMSVFARRFAPDRCVLLEPGTRLEAGGQGSLGDAGDGALDGVLNGPAGWLAGAAVLGDDGRVTSLEAA